MTGGGFKGGGGLEIGGGASFSMAAKLSQTSRPGKRFAVLFSLTPGFSPVTDRLTNQNRLNLKNACGVFLVHKKARQHWMRVPGSLTNSDFFGADAISGSPGPRPATPLARDNRAASAAPAGGARFTHRPGTARKSRRTVSTVAAP
jgi:hypothetical protein